MALQLTGAYKQASLANLQVRLPGGRHRRRPDRDRHGDRAARVLPRAGREDARALRGARAEQSASARVRAMFDDEELRDPRRVPRARHARCAPSASAPRRGEARAGLPAAARALGRRHARLSQAACIDSPAYRLNHEEVEQEPRGGRALHREHVADRGDCSTSAVTSRR